MKFNYLKVLLLILATLTSSAHAGLIQYTFTGSYGDGSAVSGTFLYDDVTEAYLDAEITLDGGSDFTDSYFDYFHYTGPHFIVLLDSTDGPAYDNDNVFHIILQDSGLFGELNPTSVYSDIASCDKDHCPARDNLHVARQTSLTGQYIDVPEPATLAIFMLALMGLAFRRFKLNS